VKEKTNLTGRANSVGAARLAYMDEKILLFKPESVNYPRFFVEKTFPLSLKFWEQNRKGLLTWFSVKLEGYIHPIVP